MELEATQLVENDQFMDHECQEASCASKSSEGKESSAAFGCGCRKRTVCLEGDICYRNIKSSGEAGSAREVIKGCEEATTTTIT